LGRTKKTSIKGIKMEDAKKGAAQLLNSDTEPRYLWFGERQSVREKQTARSSHFERFVAHRVQHSHACVLCVSDMLERKRTTVLVDEGSIQRSKFSRSMDTPV
jgi:hypothetical protein